MLAKLLKYDFKSLLKYWWIAAISSVGLSILGGSCITLINTERELPSVVYVTATFGILATVLGMSAFMILTSIIIFVRYYKNFFTDEGYLTFTLPVKKGQLLNSKLISSVVIMNLSMIILFLDLFLMLAIGLAKQIFTAEFFDGLSHFFEALLDEFGVYLIPLSLELIAVFVISSIFSTLFLYMCITFASIIAKRAKVIVAIGIYYGASTIFSFATEIFYLFGLNSLIVWFSSLPEQSLKLITVVVLFGIIILLATACMILYTIVYHMLDRKLNLS